MYQIPPVDHKTAKIDSYYTVDNHTRSLWLLFRQIIIGVGLLLSLLPLHAQAAGSLMVSPTRLVVEPDKKTGQIFIINKSNKSMTVRISLVNRRMLSDGTFTEAREPQDGEHFADDFLQYAPRRVQLAAGKGQTIRVLAQRPAGQSPGEYRSHLLFRVEPPRSDHQDIKPGADESLNDKEIDIRLVPVYGVTIPVIVRQGNLSATSSISNVTIQPAIDEGASPRVSFQLNRTGNRSVYGDIRILLKSDGVERLVSELRGVAVYVPLSGREIILPLNGLNDEALPKEGQLRIEYVAHGSRNRILAESANPIQPSID